MGPDNGETDKSHHPDVVFSPSTPEMLTRDVPWQRWHQSQVCTPSAKRHTQCKTQPRFHMSQGIHRQKCPIDLKKRKATYPPVRNSIRIF